MPFGVGESREAAAETVVRLWVDLFARHQLLDHASAFGYVYTSSIILLVGVELDELLRADATKGDRGVLELLFGYSR